MDTPLHKSYVHYQEQAMVSWEREKNPLGIQNICRYDLMQTPRRKLLLIIAQFHIYYDAQSNIFEFWTQNYPVLLARAADLLHLCVVGSREPPCMREN